MTYTLTLTPYITALLSAAALHAGLDLRTLLAAQLSSTTTAATPAAEPAPAATAQPELALSYEPTPAPAGSLGILARAARLNNPHA